MCLGAHGLLCNPAPFVHPSMHRSWRAIYAQIRQKMELMFYVWLVLLIQQVIVSVSGSWWYAECLVIAWELGSRCFRTTSIILGNGNDGLKCLSVRIFVFHNKTVCRWILVVNWQVVKIFHIYNAPISSPEYNISPKKGRKKIQFSYLFLLHFSF